MKRVIVYRNQLLPPSETFIKQQILGLSRWEAVLAGQTRVSNGLDTAGLTLLTESDFLRTRFDKLKRAIYRNLGGPKFGFYKSLAQYNASILHVHFGVDAVFAWPWWKHFKIPVVVTLHGYDISIRPEWWEKGQDAGMKRYPELLRSIATLDQVSFIAVSNAIRQKAIDLYGLPSEKIKVLYIGVDEKSFRPADASLKTKSKTVLFVGRLVEKKGASVLLQAMRQVLDQVPDAELVIVGDGPLRSDLEALAGHIGVAARFLGVRASSEVRQLMQEARIFCLPSVTAKNGDAEGFGIVILEAQACGTPVVTSAAGGRDEGISDGVTGLAFAEGDVDGLAVRLVRLLTDDELTRSMSTAGPGFIAQNFSLEGCTARLESHYDSIAS